MALAARTAAGAEHVIQISVDGLSGLLLQALVENDSVGDFASFARFVTEGATTYNARADYTYTITLPNHTTMLTGRPVSRPSGQPNTVHHGWTSNDDPAPGETLHNGGNPNLTYVASVFDVAHDHGLSTALYASKSEVRAVRAELRRRARRRGRDGREQRDRQDRPVREHVRGGDARGVPRADGVEPLRATCSCTTARPTTRATPAAGAARSGTTRCARVDDQLADDLRADRGRSRARTATRS